MGWVMLLVGLVVPLLVGWWLIGKARADLPLSLLGLAALPVLIWGSSLGAKIGPCKVGDCMSSGQHSRLVISLVALAIMALAFVLLSMQQEVAGGVVLVLGEVVGAFSMTRTDIAAAVMLLVFASAVLAYIAYRYVQQREAARMPDFPPA